MVLLHIAQLRSETGKASPREVEDLFLDLSITPPARPGNVLLALERNGLATRGRGRGLWSLAPRGRMRLGQLNFEEDLPALTAEMQSSGSSLFSGALHPLIPPEVAPPELATPLREFLATHPLEKNVFGMTRFPTSEPDALDPVLGSIEIAREAVAMHGLEFHLASDRALVDDLWANVCAHMWAAKFGIAFFEDRRGLGVNHNMMIEVGAMLMSGRRCALLKDESIARLPTDLVGRIYKSVSLTAEATVADALHRWMRDDLGLGSCKRCPVT